MQQGLRSRGPAAAGGALTNADDDRTVLALVAAGDPEALRHLYRAHGSWAFSLAYRILLHDDRAEDCVQEAFLRVWRNAARFDANRASFRTWFGRILHNICIDALRRERPARESGDLAAVENRMEFSDVPEARIVDRLAIAEAFRQLPQEQRQALDMVYFRGLTHREIAAQMAIPEGTVKSRLRLGLERMRRMLTQGAST